MYQNTSTRTAPKACNPCRDRKRKCDRLIPSCSLCYRLGRPCEYGLLSPSPSSSSSEAGQPNQRKGGDVSRKASSQSQVGDLERPDSTQAVTEHLLKAVGNLSDVRSVASRYFASIHRWLPIVSESQFYERLPSSFTNPQADINLLSLSMALIIQIPKETELNSMLSLYAIVKSCIAMTEAANVNSLETIQARYLVALFEAGHGLSAAYISIAATARAAAAFGINQTVNNPTSPSCEEGLRVWWAIVMLDRYYTLEHATGPTATQGLGTPRHLPRDGNVWDQKLLTSNAPLPMSTPSSVRVGPFARQAQVSHVVNLLLLHLQDQKTTGQNDGEESDQLARTLLAFSRLLPEETPQPWPLYCGAIGMCYGSLLTLHASRVQTSTPQKPDPFLPSMLSGISFVCQKFNARIAQVSPGSLSPFPPHGLALAAEAYLELWKEKRDLSDWERAGELLVMLKFFEGRWLGCREYVERVEAAMEKRSPESATIS